MSQPLGAQHLPDEAVHVSRRARRNRTAARATGGGRRRRGPALVLAAMVVSPRVRRHRWPPPSIPRMPVSRHTGDLTAVPSHQADRSRLRPVRLRLTVSRCRVARRGEPQHTHDQVARRGRSVVADGPLDSRTGAATSARSSTEIVDGLRSSARGLGSGNADAGVLTGPSDGRSMKNRHHRREGMT